MPRDQLLNSHSNENVDFVSPHFHYIDGVEEEVVEVVVVVSDGAGAGAGAGTGVDSGVVVGVGAGSGTGVEVVEPATTETRREAVPTLPAASVTL